MPNDSPAVDLALIGMTVRDRRERLDLMQKKVAASVGVGVRHYRQIEKGRVKASRRTYLKIAQVLDIPVEEMDQLTGHNNNGGTP